MAVTQKHLEDLVGMLGAELGRDAKRERKSMESFVEQEIRLLMRFVEGQAKTLDALNGKVNALLSGTKGKPASTHRRRT